MTRAALKKYRQIKGVEYRVIGGDQFLIHAATDAIHHIDPIGAAIWRLLAKPVTIADIETLLIAAFPDVPRGQIAVDLRRLLNNLKVWGLIREAPSSRL